MTFLILDDHASFGGTLVAHRFPAVPSDGHLYTYGYRFKPS
jgi:monooxygenase